MKGSARMDMSPLSHCSWRVFLALERAQDPKTGRPSTINPYHGPAEVNK